jgi:hypothetical protein
MAQAWSCGIAYPIQFLDGGLEMACDRCAYRAVMASVLCPISSWAVFKSTPAITNLEQYVPQDVPRNALDASLFTGHREPLAGVFDRRVLLVEK